MYPKVIATIERPDGATYRVREIAPNKYEASVEMAPLQEQVLNDVPRLLEDCILTISLHIRAHNNTMGAIAHCLARGVIQAGRA